LFDLFPQVRTVAVVTGSRLAERRNHEQAKESARSFRGKAKFDWYNELEPADLVKRLSELDPGTSVIFYLNYFLSPSGEAFSIGDSMKLITEATEAPLFVTADFLLSQGAVGGKVVSGYSQGEEGASLALRILAGERAEDIPVVMESPNRYLFSQAALERYGISPRALPPTSLLVAPDGSTVFADWEGASKKIFSGYDVFMKNVTPMLLIDPDSGAIVDANQAARTFYRYPGLKGMNIRQINMLPPHEVTAEMQKAFGREVQFFDFRHKLADGSVRDVGVLSSPVSVEGKELLISMVIDETEKKAAHDAMRQKNRWIVIIIGTALALQSAGLILLLWSIRRRKRAEDALRESEGNLRALFSSMTEIVVLHELVFDDQGKPVDYIITGCNGAFTAVTGIPAEKAVGRMGSEVYGLVRAPYLDEYVPVALTGEPRSFETYYPPMDRHFRISVVSPGKNKFATVTADFTDIKRAEEELRAASREAERLRFEAEAASRAKSAFLANTSHELRTPLNGAIGFLELLAGTSLDSRQREYVGYIRSSAVSLMEVVSEVLDISRIEAGEFRLETGAADINDIVREALDAVRGNALEKNIDLKLRLEESTTRYASIDSARLKQILVNLLGNAVKFTEKGAVELAVKASLPEGGMCDYTFSVQDTGIGIPAEIQQEIFEPFYQQDASFTRKHGGVGLGIPICDSILRRMGSRLELESTPGAGSRFFFTLRVRCAPSPDKRISDERIGKIGATSLITLNTNRPVSVLIAEDHKLNRRLLNTMLSKLLPGVIILEAVNGVEAVELCLRESPDLVLMDLHMPVKDGRQAAEDIRAAERERGEARTPIIAVTADVQAETKKACMESGMDGYLAKPLEAADLRAALEENLKGLLS
ncbi:MAG: ATP-binding protein, partial [Aminivibrio sp.]